MLIPSKVVWYAHRKKDGLNEGGKLIRFENVNKIQQSNLKAKYLLLKDIGAMDEETVKLEIEKVFEEIEDTAEIEKSSANQEITYNG